MPARRAYAIETLRYRQAVDAACRELGARQARAVASRRARGLDHEARSLAAYLVVTLFSIPRRRLARAIGFNHGTITRWCARVEDSRDAPERDALIERIEKRLGTA